VYNFTEASFDKTSPLWFAFLMVMSQYRDSRQPAPADLVGANDASNGVDRPRPLPPEARW
jgi:hypothetical protein